MEIKDTNIIVTGAGSGFGKEMAIQFSKSGANVISLDVNEKSLINLKNKIPETETYICDVSDNIQVEKTVEEIFIKFKSIEILVNNAGIMKNSPLINFFQRPDRKHSIDLWQKVIEINQNSVFFMTRAIADKMILKRTKGVIINISSIAAQGNAGQTAYSASKAAVEAMTKVWAKELGSFGIRSVGVAPGFIDTAGTHDAIEEKMLQHWIEQTPLRRTGKISEVIKTIYFVIENDFINGEIINVNGGLKL